MKLTKYLFFLIAIYCFTGELSAQYDYPGDSPSEQKVSRRKRPDDSKLYFGGNIGLMFRKDYGYFEFSPYAGYKLTPRFWLGAGPKYMYFKQGSIQTSVYGVKSFASFAVLDKINEMTNLSIGSIFLYLENELLSIEPIYFNPTGYYYIEPRDWYDIVLGGIGIRVPVSQHAGFSMMVLWGLSESAQMLYSNPEIRITFDF